MNLVSILMAVLMMLNLAPQSQSGGAQTQQVFALSGIISQVEEQGLMLESEQSGQVLVNLSDETVFEGLEKDELRAGQYIFVDYDGKMTRSLPPQVSAQRIAMYAVSGVVSEVSENSVTISREQEGDQVVVHLPEGADALYVGCPVTAYTDGVMTASIPGQVNARHVETPTLEGKISAVQEGSFSMTTGQGEEYTVNMGEDTVLSGALKSGGKVKVYYNGAATFSIPPQVAAIAVEVEA